MAFLDSLAARAIGLLSGEQLPQVCADALEEGYESTSLAALAGEYGLPYDPWRHESLFEEALRELKLSLPGTMEAAALLIRRNAESVVAGSLTPREGSRRILEVYSQVESEVPVKRYVGDGLGIERLVGIFYSHDDVPFGQEHLHAKIDADLLDECTKLSGVV
ncbi:MAG: hypothetical protein ACREAA_20765 [Candidatus Polarisedimenticolia bacterium]